MAECSVLLMVDVFTNKFYSLAEKQLVSLGGDDTEFLGGGGSDEDYRTVVVGSSHGWIALFNYEPLELFLWNPVNRRRINLPPIDNLPTPKNEFNGGYCYVEISKLILSSSNPEDADCRVIVLYGTGCSRLAFCCPGQSSADWISIGTWWYHFTDDSVEDRLYENMAYSSQQNRLFCITGDVHYGLERWDLEDPWSVSMDGDDSGQRREEVIYQYEHKQDEHRSTYIVIAEDEVLVVVRKLYEGITTGFIIFKVVQGERGKLTMHSLHSLDARLAMFVGLNHSFALSATEFPELKPNSIYFTDAVNRYDIGIFDYQSRTFYSCYSPKVHGSQQHRNAKEYKSEEEYNDGSDEEHNAEEKEDNDGSFKEHNDEESNDGGGEEHNAEEDDNDGSSDEGVFYSQPKFVWFRYS